MTEEKRLWDEVLARLPRPFKDSVGVCQSAVFLLRGRVATLLADVERNRIVIRRERPPICLGGSTTERIAHLLTDAVFEKVLESLRLPVTPPWKLNPTREFMVWTPTGEMGAFLDGFRSIEDLKAHLINITGFKHRVALADAHAPQYSAARVGTVPDPSFVGATCVRCGRVVDNVGATEAVTIYVW